MYNNKYLYNFKLLSKIKKELKFFFRDLFLFLNISFTYIKYNVMKFALNIIMEIILHIQLFVKIVLLIVKLVLGIKLNNAIPVLLVSFYLKIK